MSSEDEVIYFCHNCDKNVVDIEETDDGCLKCKLCDEEYVEIVQSDFEEEEEEQEEKKEENANNNNPNNNHPNNNRNNFQFINNGNVSVFFANINHPNNGNANQMMQRMFNNFFGMNRMNRSGTIGDYAFGDINNIISSLGLNGNRGPPPANKEIVKNLKEFIFDETQNHKNEQDENEDNKTCPICKDKFVSGDKCKEMPCSHLYHKDCIEHWLNNANNCPVCRHRLKTDDAIYEQMHSQSTQQ